MIAPEAVVTFAQPDGFTVVRTLGIARGEASRQRSTLGAVLRIVRLLAGFGQLDAVTEAERARRDCLNALLSRAEHLGANGVVNLRFEAHEEHDGSTVVRAVGDAVVLHPAPRERL
jgi:uncharacterized protein YbjQ (UPF0145 family)